MDDLLDESDDASDYDAQAMSLAQQAFPEMQWDEERTSALKELIHYCMEMSHEGKDGESALLIAPSAPKKGRQKADGLAALFGDK